MLYSGLWFIYKTNKPDPDREQQEKIAFSNEPCIFVLWHGQHLLSPFFAPKGSKFTALVSKSADAEINARILKIAGHDVVRGSGGRVREAMHEKGGVSATLNLKNKLKAGENIAVIADVSKSEPRKSGRGVVSLAKISGRPIVPLAVATSRFKVVEKSWDKTTINMPFGRSGTRAGNPIYVPSDCSPEELDDYRKKVDDELNRVTIEAYGVVGHSL
jgi:lysophospholipid acyltransferase (LPLAT)-like uncharacterized protein